MGRLVRGKKRDVCNWVAIKFLCGGFLIFFLRVGEGGICRVCQLLSEVIFFCQRGGTCQVRETLKYHCCQRFAALRSGGILALQLIRITIVQFSTNVQ